MADEELTKKIDEITERIGSTLDLESKLELFEERCKLESKRVLQQQALQGLQENELLASLERADLPCYREESTWLWSVINSKLDNKTIPLADSDPDVGDDEKKCKFSFLTSREMIFVRESYLKIYDLLTSAKFTLISGNPGFGKSFFGYYVMYRLRQEQKEANIIYVNTVRDYSAFICKDGIFVKSKSYRRKFLDDGKNTWYIHDCGTRDGKPDMLLAKNCTRTIVLSSPAKDNYAEFKKEGCNTLYMPPWSLLECHIWSTVCNIENYEERFWYWGGNAREVFSESFDTIDLVQAIYDINHLEFVVASLKDVAAGRGDKYSHKVLHLFPTDDSYKKVEVRFPSRFVSREVYKRLKTKSHSGVLKLIRDCSEEPILAGIRGPLFEQFSHDRFSKRGEYPVRNLKNGELSTLTVNAVGILRFNELSEVSMSNVYYTPESKSFKSVDSILPMDEAFQMTVSYNHPVQYSGLKVIKDQLNCDVLKLYFVVPEENFDTFSLQKYLTVQKKNCVVQNKTDVEQFVLSMHGY